mmetsp:Transcript_8503/g.13332  ORF Transcript_8503/g.13332 Transcript_8503/m.13332 type:complete len:218 (-) Transcript_8503:594-1247(-)
MNQPKPNGFQRGPSDDGDKLMVASGRHADDPPAVPRPQELKEWMQVTQIRGSLRERVFNYVTSTDVGRAGLSDKVRILEQAVQYERDLEELQDFLDYKALPIPLFEDKSPSYTNAKTRRWGDKAEHSPKNQVFIPFQVAKTKFHGYSRLIAERKREEVEQMETMKTRDVEMIAISDVDVEQWDKCTSSQEWKKIAAAAAAGAVVVGAPLVSQACAVA